MELLETKNLEFDLRYGCIFDGEEDILPQNAWGHDRNSINHLLGFDFADMNDTERSEFYRNICWQNNYRGLNHRKEDGSGFVIGFNF